jgi:hypothetical protein
MFEMNHYVQRTPDGLVHVTNMVGPYEGQHHVHTEKQFTEWAKQVSSRNIKLLEGCDPCDCGLRAGEVRNRCR